MKWNFCCMKMKTQYVISTCSFCNISMLCNISVQVNNFSCTKLNIYIMSLYAFHCSKNFCRIKHAISVSNIVCSPLPPTVKFCCMKKQKCHLAKYLQCIYITSLYTFFCHKWGKQLLRVAEATQGDLLVYYIHK